MKRGKPPSCPALLTFSSQGPFLQAAPNHLLPGRIAPFREGTLKLSRAALEMMPPTPEYDTSQTINFCTDFLGEREEYKSCCMFPFGEGADSGTCQASVILQYRQ